MTHASFRAPRAPGILPAASRPTFSVVIAAHNAADTISEAVESVLAQTVPPLELIVCDDGSTDATATVLEAYLPRVHYLQRPHGGVASAWNTALAVARGDFFAVLGADDAYLPRRLELLAELAHARPDLALLCTDLMYEIDGRAVGRFEETCPFAVVDQRVAILERCFCAAPAIRRDVLVRLGGFDESMRTGSDWECAIRLILDGAVAGFVPEPLYRYRIRADSLTGDRLATLRERIAFLERVGRTQTLQLSEQAALDRSLNRQRASLVLGEAEVAIRTRAAEARSRALQAARTRNVAAHMRAAAVAAAVAPRAAARALEWRERVFGDRRVRSPLART